MYSFLAKLSNWALFFLCFALALAAVDHYFFDEVYKGSIKIFGIIALAVFFVAIFAAVIKGALDKKKY